MSVVQLKSAISVQDADISSKDAYLSSFGKRELVLEPTKISDVRKVQDNLKKTLKQRSQKVHNFYKYIV